MIGYKGFNKDMTDRYGNKFEINETYQVNGEVFWGIHGYHMCQNIEDCFRYVDPKISTFALVEGSGQIKLHEDEYYGYYDMYVCEKMKVLKILSREEIINLLLKASEDRKERFAYFFDLSEEEKNLFGGALNGKYNYQRCEGKQLKKYKHNLTKK